MEEKIIFVLRIPVFAATNKTGDVWSQTSMYCIGSKKKKKKYKTATCTKRKAIWDSRHTKGKRTEDRQSVLFVS